MKRIPKLKQYVNVDWQRVRIAREKLSSKQFQLLLFLALQCRHDDKVCWWGYKALAGALGWAYSTVKEASQVLQDREWIKCQIEDGGLETTTVSIVRRRKKGKTMSLRCGPNQNEKFATAGPAIKTLMVLLENADLKTGRINTSDGLSFDEFVKKLTGQSVCTVKRHIQALKKANLLFSHPGRKGAVRNQHHWYISKTVFQK